MKNENTFSNEQNQIATNKVYTADQVLQLAEKITLSALKHLYAKTGNDFNRRLYINLINDLNSKQASDYNISDSYDLVLDLYGYIADRFYYTTLDDVIYYAIDLQATDNDGICIYKWLYRYLYNAIYRIKVIDTKKVYLDEQLGIAVMPDYNIDDYHTYKVLKSVLVAMRLTKPQARYVKYRLQGLSTVAISKKMNITQQAVVEFQRRTANKFNKVANKLLDADLLTALKRKYNL